MEEKKKKERDSLFADYRRRERVYGKRCNQLKSAARIFGHTTIRTYIKGTRAQRISDKDDISREHVGKFHSFEKCFTARAHVFPENILTYEK